MYEMAGLGPPASLAANLCVLLLPTFFPSPNGSVPLPFAVHGRRLLLLLQCSAI